MMLWTRKETIRRVLLEEIPEETITSAAEYFGNGSGPHVALGIAEKWRAVGMTPIFLNDEDRHGLLVVSKETHGVTVH